MILKHSSFIVSSLDLLGNLGLEIWESPLEQLTQDIKLRDCNPIIRSCEICSRECKVHTASGLMKFDCMSFNCKALIKIF